MSFEKGKTFVFPNDRAVFETELKDYILASRKDHSRQQTGFYDRFDDAILTLNSEEREYLDEVVNSLLSKILGSQEVANAFYRSDAEGWKEFTTNPIDRKAENPKALRIAGRTTLREVFTNAQDYQDMIGWSSFRFGRDAQKMPDFDMGNFYDSIGGNPVFVISPLWITLTFTKKKGKKGFDYFMNIRQKAIKLGQEYPLRGIIEEANAVRIDWGISHTEPAIDEASGKGETYLAYLSLDPSPFNLAEKIQDAKQNLIEEKGVFSGEWVVSPESKQAFRKSGGSTLDEKEIKSITKNKSIKLPINISEEILSQISYDNLLDTSDFMVNTKKEKQKFFVKIDAGAVWQNFDPEPFVQELIKANNDINKVVANRYIFTTKAAGKEDDSDEDKTELKGNSIENLHSRIKENLANRVLKATSQFVTYSEWDGLPFTRSSLKVSDKFKTHLDRFKERIFDLQELGFTGGE